MSDKATTAGAARLTRILAVMFFLVGALLCAERIYKSAQIILAEREIAARSAILSVMPDRCADSVATTRAERSTRTHRSPRATYNYAYEVGGVAYTGRGTLEDECEQPLGSMDITYLVAEPGKSELVALKDKRTRDAYLSPLAGLFMLLIAAWGARLMWREGDFKPEAEPAPPGAPPSGGDAW